MLHAPMRKVMLSPSNFEVSALGYGCARLHHVSSSQRDRLVGVARDCGITHFDTAPSYGDGLAEIALSRMRAAARAQISIATKVGFAPDPLIASAPQLAKPVQALRALARNLGAPSSPRKLFSPAMIESSLHQSLRRLRTDYIDILFLHEPKAELLPDPGAVLASLERLIAAGKVRHVGLAGAWASIAFLAQQAAFANFFIQTDESDWPTQSPPAFTYGALSRGPQSFAAGRIAENDAITRLKSALARRPNGAVLVSTTRTEHLAQLTAAV